MCVRKVGKQGISFIHPQAPSGWIYVKFGLEIGASFSKLCQILWQLVQGFRSVRLTGSKIWPGSLYWPFIVNTGLCERVNCLW